MWEWEVVIKFKDRLGREEERSPSSKQQTSHSLISVKTKVSLNESDDSLKESINVSENVPERLIYVSLWPNRGAQQLQISRQPLSLFVSSGQTEWIIIVCLLFEGAWW